MLLSVAAPLASAKSAEARESLLSAWCAEAGVRIVWDGLRRQLGSRALLNSVDGLAALVNSRSASDQPASGLAQFPCMTRTAAKWVAIFSLMFRPV